MSDLPAEKIDSPEKQPATLTVDEMGEVKVEMPRPEINMDDRDPGNMNEHVKIRFGDIIAEPDPEVFSFDKVWQTSFTAFTQTKIWCYRITTAVLGIPLAVFWGCYFACMAFCTVWCCVPCLRSEEMEMLCIRKIWKVFLDTFLAPCCAAVGQLFSGIRVKHHHENKD